MIEYHRRLLTYFINQIFLCTWLTPCFSGMTKNQGRSFPGFVFSKTYSYFFLTCFAICFESLLYLKTSTAQLMICVEIVINAIIISVGCMLLPPFSCLYFYYYLFILITTNIVKLIIKFEIRGTSSRNLVVD